MQLKNMRSHCVRTICVVAAALVMYEEAYAQSSCPAANPNDQLPDDVAINACLSAGGTVTLVAGTPGYIIRDGLVLSVSNTVLQGMPGTRPLLIADPQLQAPMLWVKQTAYPTGYVIRDLAFDGRKDQRVYESHCWGDRNKGYNLKLSGASWTIERVDSDNALCGSALEGECQFCAIRQSRIRNNGTSHTLHPYKVADGLTLAWCNGGDIRNNEVGNNTDVNLIVGPGQNCRVTENWVWQTIVGQVGLMVGFAGDHSTSRVDHNLVQALPNALGVGLMVGDHPWDVNGTMINAGLVDNNTVEGTVVLGAVDGILGGTLADNVGTNPQGVLTLPNCLPYVYTAGHHGAASLQPGWAFQTYHNGACQQQ